MKYFFILPLSALGALLLFYTLVSLGVLPPGTAILEMMQARFVEYGAILLFLIILLEAIVYVGFYFPGQFFAVLLVVAAKPSTFDMLTLTLAMVFAATLASCINFFLGRISTHKTPEGNQPIEPFRLRSLGLAMIHINCLAFYMFSQGATGQPSRVIWLAGLLNLPYYLLLIVGTALLSEQVMAVAESNYFLISVVSLWLLVSVVLDVRKHRKNAKWQRKQYQTPAPASQAEV